MATTSTPRVRKSAKKNLKGSIRSNNKKRKAKQALRYLGNNQPKKPAE